MEEKRAAFRFAPSRWKGILFLTTVCGLLIFLEIRLFRQFNTSNVGLQFFLLLIALLIFAVPLIFLLYRLYSLIFSVYYLERDGLHIQWGLRKEVIPLNAIEWIRSPAEMTEDVPWSVLPMPGAYLGTVEVDEHLTYEFLASDMSKMLFLRTSRFVYVVSPQNPAAFMTGFERILQMGTLTNVPWTTARPGNWILEAWHSKAGRISTLLSMLFLGGAAFSGNEADLIFIFADRRAPGPAPVREYVSDPAGSHRHLGDRDDPRPSDLPEEGKPADCRIGLGGSFGRGSAMPDRGADELLTSANISPVLPGPGFVFDPDLPDRGDHLIIE